MTELPQGWTTVPLAAVATIKTGPFGSALHKSDYQPTGIPIVNPMHIRGGLIQPGSDARVGEAKLRDLAEFRLAEGDVVLGRRGEMGRCAVVGKAEAGWLCGTGSLILRPNGSVEPRYLQRFMSSPSVVARLEGDSVGSTMVNLNQGILRALDIPIPSLAEQRRIADKLDALLARVDACRDRLDRVPTILNRFRQAVLNAAVDGYLTEEWRGGGLKSWSFERAADVCAKVQSGGTPKEGFTTSGVPFLKVYNIVHQRIDFAYRPQFIAHDVHSSTLSKSLTLPGDVLMNIVGPPLGKVAVVTDEYPAWNINQAITLFRPSPRVSTGWLYCVLCSGKNIQSIIHETRGSAGQVNISLSQCRDFVIPVPPRDEQAEIVRRVESLFALADAIEAKWQAARAQVERLTPALLAKAFRGELVPQDPNDEPASTLLTRLRGSAEADAVPARKPGRRKTVKETAA